jgi:hypothetical protein
MQNGQVAGEMNRLLFIAKILALFNVSLLCAVMAVSVYQVSARVDGAISQLKVSATIAGMNQTLDAINRPCGNGKPCGTLADVAKTLGTIRGAAGQIEVAANHEDKRIDQFDAQEATIYTNTNASLLQLREDLKTANTTIAGLQPVFVGLGKDAAALQLTTESADTLISNPQIPVILNNTAAATGHVQQAAGHLDAATADVQQAVHQALHPTVVHKVLSVVENVGHIVFAIVF